MALCEHPALREAAVVGVASDPWGETPKAFVVRAVGAAGVGVTAADLIEHCRTRIAHYKCPGPASSGSARSHATRAARCCGGHSVIPGSTSSLSR
ncbi:MAG: AMP-binding enzyme [Solirubrobacteraceae bacterium]